MLQDAELTQVSIPWWGAALNCGVQLTRLVLAGNSNVKELSELAPLVSLAVRRSEYQGWWCTGTICKLKKLGLVRVPSNQAKGLQR